MQDNTKTTMQHVKPHGQHTPISQTKRKSPSDHTHTHTERERDGRSSETSLCYTVVYVKDVAASVAFYADAFGCHVRALDHSHRWGELESRQTTIAFTPAHQRETDEIAGEVTDSAADMKSPPIQLCFAYDDVNAAYKRAVEKGAVPVSAPADRAWGQKVGYVRDRDGMVVRMGSSVKQAP